MTCVVVSRNDRGLLSITIDDLVAALERETTRTIGDWEILIVDDASSDGTPEEARALSAVNPKILAVCIPAATGFGAAFYTGLALARFPLVLLTGGDAQFDFSELGAFLHYADRYEAVIGYRLARQDRLLWRAASHGWNALVSLLFGLRLQDLDCPLKLFRRSALEAVGVAYLRSRDSIINTELMVRFARCRKEVLEAPVSQARRGKALHGRPITPVTVGRAILRLASLRGRLLLEGLIGYFGFVFGVTSRSGHPMEVMLYRRGRQVSPEHPVRSCTLCGAPRAALLETVVSPRVGSGLVAVRRVLFCASCRNGFSEVPHHPSALGARSGQTREKAPRVDRFRAWAARRRLARALRNVRIPPGSVMRVADFGGGQSEISDALRQLGLDVTTINPNLRGDLEEGPLTPEGFGQDRSRPDDAGNAEHTTGLFDFVTMWLSLPSSHDPVGVLRTARRLLRPGGLLFLCVPNVDSLQADLAPGRLSSLADPRDNFHFSLAGLLQLLERAHFREARVNWLTLEYDLLRVREAFFGRASYRILWWLLFPVLGPASLAIAAFSWVVGKPAVAEITAYRPTEEA